MAEVESDAEMLVDSEASGFTKMNGELNGSDDAMDTSECSSHVSANKGLHIDNNCDEISNHSNQSNSLNKNIETSNRNNDDESNEDDKESNEDEKESNEDDKDSNIDDKESNTDDKESNVDDNDERNGDDKNINDLDKESNSRDSSPDRTMSSMSQGSENPSRNHSQASNHSISSNESLQSEFSNTRNKEISEDSSSVKPIEDGIVIPDSDSEDEPEPAHDESDDEEDIVSNGVSIDEPMSIHSDSDVEDEHKEVNKVEDVKMNGTKKDEVHEIEESDKEDSVITLETPEKKDEKKEQEKTPRRSSRNIARKVYSEDYEQDLRPKKPATTVQDETESDLEEVSVADPLGDPLGHKPGPKSKTKINNAPIVVKDTKRLVEITAKNISSTSPSTSKSGKKSPTLVIIDTNSILSGRGAMPMNSKQGFSVLPVAVPAQGMYPPNMRATITPVNTASLQKPITVQPIPNLVLPSLTDDMFVVEAPSFIVPYVYEKPPSIPFRDFVDKMAKEVDEARKLAEEREREESKNRKENGDEKMETNESIKDETKEPEVKSKKSKKSHKRKAGDDDDSWDENDTSDSEDEDDVVGEKIEKEVLVKDLKEDSLEAIKKHIITPETAVTTKIMPEKKSDSYFDNPIGKFFMNIGINLVQEHVQTDLLKQQKRKRDRENRTSTNSTATQMAINSLIKNLEFSKENNEPYHFEQKKCEICNFKTESALALAHHMETPHMRNCFYRCNFCSYEIRSPHDILFHMEAEHNTRGRLERAASYHQCPNCPFEDNGKAKLSRHQLACAKKFKPEVNLGPPVDWEPPAKIPRTSRPKQSLTSAATAYHQAMATQNRVQPPPKLPGSVRGRGRPSINKTTPMAPGSNAMMRGNMMYRPQTAMQNNQLLLPANYSYSGNQLIQVVGTSVNMLPGMVATSSGSVTIQTTPSSGANKSSNSSKILHQPSISITPLPRQSTSSTQSSNASSSNSAKPGQQTSGKASFVICEICDGYIKDLDQLRNHMQWIHKVKIHPKMIYNRPPLNCQKCQFRFFTDQGLERHLLGSHGLVTSSMQEAANKGKDAGRCPVCGRVYQWKLLNHVNRDHNMTLKPAHLSYKCTVCTATFGMYKQFENHVYSAHSVVAKKVMDKKPAPSTAPSSKTTSGDSLLKPLKINDEITIIPQPPKPRAGPASRTGSSMTVTKK